MIPINMQMKLKQRPSMKTVCLSRFRKNRVTEETARNNRTINSIFLFPLFEHYYQNLNINFPALQLGGVQPSAFSGAALWLLACLTVLRCPPPGCSSFPSRCPTPLFVPVSDIRSCKCAGFFKKHSGKTATRSAWQANRCSNRRLFPEF